mmetsp:Transcript_11540/g.11519  ORF Transcript_11540/g.11519 Transcript_11540/m.11519 type:complete len:106 (+) Transcript_11540:106-423(+)
MRLVCHKYNGAVFVGLNCLVHELVLFEDKCNYILENDFDEESQNQHKKLSERELEINKSLKASLKEARKKDALFKSIKDISYLVKPPRMIAKPIIAALILLHKAP